MSDLDKEKESLEAGKTYLTSELDDKVELKGTKPESGNVTISNQNSVASAILVINGYTINYNGLDESYTINNGNTNSNNNCIGSGIFSITLKEQNMAIELEQDTNWLKSFVDKALKEMFTNIESMTQVQIEEIIKIQNGNYTWSSKDESIVAINGTKVTPKKIGSTAVIATTDKGAVVTIPLKVIETVNLSEKAEVGDYVDYDVTPAGKGWRVLSINKTTNTVTIVHAGAPENYYHTIDTYTGVKNLNNIAQKYKDSTYADSAHAMNYGEANVIAQSNNLRNIGSNYWMASPYDSRDLYYVNSSGSIDNKGYTGYTFGMRPVVVLKSNIKTTGKTTDAVGQEAWSLVKP